MCSQCVPDVYPTRPQCVLDVSLMPPHPTSSWFFFMKMSSSRSASISPSSCSRAMLVSSSTLRSPEMSLSTDVRMASSASYLRGTIIPSHPHPCSMNHTPSPSLSPSPPHLYPYLYPYLHPYPFPFPHPYHHPPLSPLPQHSPHSPKNFYMTQLSLMNTHFFPEFFFPTDWSH